MRARSFLGKTLNKWDKELIGIRASKLLGVAARKINLVSV